MTNLEKLKQEMHQTAHRYNVLMGNWCGGISDTTNEDVNEASRKHSKAESAYLKAQRSWNDEDHHE